MVQLNRFNITNQYLYGTLSTPANLVNERLIRAANAVTEINVAARDYMAGPGRFAIPSQFELIRRFFENSLIPPKLDPNGNPTFYSKLELRDAIAPDLRFFGWTMKQFDYADGINDFLDRVWIYNSSGYKISDDAKFFVDLDGNRWIEDLAILPEPLTEDFDFETTSPLSVAGLGNAVALPSIDPSGIGRKVLINYVNPELVSRDKRYTRSEYIADVNRSQSWRISDGPLRLLQQGNNFLEELFNAGVTKFLDGNKPIFYGSLKGDNLSPLVNTPTLEPFKKNGLIVIGGGGNDTIVGSAAGGNILFGNEGNDLIRGKIPGNPNPGITLPPPGSDTLEGGGGNDILRGSSTLEDTAIFADAFANYDIKSQFDFFGGGTVTTITHARGTQSDGTDKLTDIEFAVFSDIKIKLDLDFVTGGQKIEASLTGNDLKNPDRQGRFADDYLLTGVGAGQEVSVYLTSPASGAQIDPFLQVLNGDTGVVIASDDDGGFSLNSQLSFTVEANTSYIIRATSYRENDVGPYTLTTSTSPFFAVNGSLTTSDLDNPNRPGRFADTYLLSGVSVGEPIQLNLNSPSGTGNFDTYLQLVNADTGVTIASDDDSGIDLNAELFFLVSPGINYLVRATSYGLEATGDYILTTNFGTLS